MYKFIAILEEFENSYWTTKNNQKIKIKDLSVSHLENIYKNLKRSFDSLENPINYYPSFTGDMAQMSAEHQWQIDMNHYKQLERKVQLFEVYYKLKNLK